MTRQTSVPSPSGDRLHRMQQTIKWIVYGLLLVNFGYYIYEDWTRAIHTITDASTIFDYASAFATSIDELAWFILLFMFELETYVLEENQWTRWTSVVVRGVRIACIVMIGHTVVAFHISLNEHEATVPVQNASSLCDLTGKDLSYVHNLEYHDITIENCDSLSFANQFYFVGKDPVVASIDGLNLERDLLWADYLEVIFWLIVLVMIEFVVQMQSRGVLNSLWIDTANRVKWVLYGFLLLIGVYWASLSHWIYLWDEMLWIGGFAVIEMNVNEWRGHLRDRLAFDETGPT